eukprot:11349077-Karenia_brevis.AAC.1
MHRGSHLGSRGVECQRIQRFLSAPITMPFIPLEEDEQAKALKGGRADLKWLMADNEVSEDIQAVMFAGGFDRLSTFMGLGETRAE